MADSRVIRRVTKRQKVDHQHEKPDSSVVSAPQTVQQIYPVYGGPNTDNFQQMQPSISQQPLQPVQYQMQPHWNQAHIQERNYPTIPNMNMCAPIIPGPGQWMRGPVPMQRNGMIRPEYPQQFSQQLQHHLMPQGVDQAMLIRQQQSMANLRMPMMNPMNPMNNIPPQMSMAHNNNPTMPMPVRRSVHPTMKTNANDVINMGPMSMIGMPITDSSKQQPFHNVPMMNPNCQTGLYPANYRGVAPMLNRAQMMDPRSSAIRQQLMSQQQVNMVGHVRGPFPRPPMHPNGMNGLKSGVPRMQAPTNMQNIEIARPSNSSAPAFASASASASASAPAPAAAAAVETPVPSMLNNPQHRRRLQNQLILLLHTHKCVKRQHHSKLESFYCRFGSCKMMKVILVHVSICKVGRDCKVKFCSSSKMIMRHWINCLKEDCLVCQPVRLAEKNQMTDIILEKQDQFLMANVKTTPDDTEIQDLSHEIRESGPPTVISSTVPPITNNSMQQNIAADDSSQPVSPNENCQSNSQHLGNSQPAQLQENSMQDSTSWKIQTTPELRKCIVHQFVISVIDLPAHSIELDDPKLHNLLLYAEKTEEDIFNSSKSKFEYYRSLSLKVFTLQTEITNKRLKRQDIDSVPSQQQHQVQLQQRAQQQLQQQVQQQQQLLQQQVQQQQQQQLLQQQVQQQQQQQLLQQQVPQQQQQQLLQQQVQQQQQPLQIENHQEVQGMPSYCVNSSQQRQINFPEHESSKIDNRCGSYSNNEVSSTSNMVPNPGSVPLTKHNQCQRSPPQDNSPLQKHSPIQDYSPLQNDSQAQIFSTLQNDSSVQNNLSVENYSSSQNHLLVQNNSLLRNSLLSQNYSVQTQNSLPHQEYSISNPSPVQNPSSVQEYSPVPNSSPIQNPPSVQEYSPIPNPSSVQNPLSVQEYSPIPDPSSIQKYSPPQNHSTPEEYSTLANPSSVQKYSPQNYSSPEEYSTIPNPSPARNNFVLENSLPLQNHSLVSNPLPVQNRSLLKNPPPIQNFSSPENYSPPQEYSSVSNPAPVENGSLLQKYTSVENNHTQFSETNIELQDSEILSMLQEQGNLPIQGLIDNYYESCNSGNLVEMSDGILSDQNTQSLASSPNRPQSYSSISPNQIIAPNSLLPDIINNHDQLGDGKDTLENSSISSRVAAIIETLKCENSPSPPTNNNNKGELDSMTGQMVPMHASQNDYYKNYNADSGKKAINFEEKKEIQDEPMDESQEPNFEQRVSADLDLKQEEVPKPVERIDTRTKEGLQPNFTPEELRQALLPTLEKLYCQDPESLPFRQPVDPTFTPDYPKIIKNPIDLSTIKHKLDMGEYREPWGYIDDIHLMFENAWLYNRKATRIYKFCNKLAEIFSQNIDPVMQNLGYCCGQKFKFDPRTLCCYGKELCTIPRDSVYYSFQNRFTYCKDCFEGIEGNTVTLKDNLAQEQKVIEKKNFQMMVNNVLDPEPLVACNVCHRKGHTICALHSELIWPQGFTCDFCLKKKREVRKKNVFTAKCLPETKLSSYIENRVNNFLRKRTPRSCNVTIRVVASSDKKVEVKSAMRSKFVENGKMPGEFPYRAKTIFAFEEIDGAELCFFGMHIQEYGNESGTPNARRVYIAYLDSVHFFNPKKYRTAVYHEILLGYLDYAKQLGYSMAHIWACPPSEGDDYIFHCHPPDQKIPKLRRLQEWYKKMLDKGMNEKIIMDYKDIVKQALEDQVSSVAELPYFEGDYWPNCLEDTITRFDWKETATISSGVSPTTNEAEASSSSINLGTDKKRAKKSHKPKASQRKAAKKCFIPQTGNDLLDKILIEMDKHKENFFVVRLHSMQRAACLGPICDPDPLINCELMDGRDAFLTMARERNYEFSSLRRAKFATMMMLYELHNQSQDKFVYVCDNCKNHVETRLHCTVCDDYDLCMNCAKNLNHPHPMEKLGFDLDISPPSSVEIEQRDPQEQKKLSIHRCIQSLIHASQCRDANCRRLSCSRMKTVTSHAKICRSIKKDKECCTCKQLFALCWYHTKRCKEMKCPVPFCTSLKYKMKQQQLQQRLHQAQLLRRRMAVLNINQVDNISYTQQTQNEVTPMTLATPVQPGVVPQARIPSTPAQLFEAVRQVQEEAARQQKIFSAGKGKIPPSGGTAGQRNAVNAIPTTQQTTTDHVPVVEGVPLLSMDQWASRYRLKPSTDIRPPAPQQTMRVQPIQNQGRVSADMRGQPTHMPEFNRSSPVVTIQSQNRTHTVINERNDQEEELDEETTPEESNQIRELLKISPLIAAIKQRQISNGQYDGGSSAPTDQQLQKVADNQHQQSSVHKPQLQIPRDMQIQEILNQQKEQFGTPSAVQPKEQPQQGQLNQAAAIQQQLYRQRMLALANQQQQQQQQMHRQQNFTEPSVSANYDQQRSVVRPPFPDFNNAPWNGSGQ